ncbi:glycosyltransferase family 1 protein [Sphingobacteriales bacterium UPWRP_1]|nr:hypothetical protein B6N25_17260 [Sphingobacteriales bacterium TSM_CSS]PSJ73138.1 glycosyltransferase family 1 protein [Sphingobacteriales bacterium UPWRP_1]
MEKQHPRINLLHLSTARTWRGGEQQIAYLFDELARQPQINQLIVCARNSAMHRYCVQNNLPHVALVKVFSFNLLFAYQLKQICQKHQIHLVHLHDPHAHQFAILSADVFGNPVPCVLSRRVDFAVKNSRYSRYKYNHPIIKKILCVSEAVRQVMLPVIQQPQRLERIYSGIDLHKYENAKAHGLLRKQYSINPDEQIIGNTGALTEQKGYFVFLDTARLIVNAGVKAKFFIIGHGHLEKKLKNYAEAQQLQDRVIFTGFRPDVAALLPEFDLFLSTSVAEGLGTSVADAMACGIPVVATASGGTVELVIPDQTGLLSPVGNSSHLAQNVLRLLQNPALAQQLAGNARLHIQQFSKAETARQTLNVYRQTLGYQ